MNLAHTSKNKTMRALQVCNSNCIGQQGNGLALKLTKKEAAGLFLNLRYASPRKNSIITKERRLVSTEATQEPLDICTALSTGGWISGVTQRLTRLASGRNVKPWETTGLSKGSTVSATSHKNSANLAVLGGPELHISWNLRFGQLTQTMITRKHRHKAFRMSFH